VTHVHLLFGGGGILGSGYRSVLARAGADVVRLRPRWENPGDAAQVLAGALDGVEARTTVVWAAGVGHTGADVGTMSRETAAVESVCEVLERLPAPRHVGVSVLFASSAGALYGGHGDAEVSEADEPSPVTTYGHEKLAQEGVLRELHERTGCRVVICRYSNVYGLADGRLTARGLVSTAVRATRLRQPMVVYVSPDTRRDLVFSVDAAAQSLRLLESGGAGVTTALVTDGETRTVGDVLGVVGRVSGRRVPATYAERPETRLQPKVLRFRPPPREPDGVRRTPMEVAIHLMLRAPMTL